MAENLRHWSALSKTDPKHTKGFTRAGGFKGTAIKPIWSTKRLTEHFGPCGIGWGMTEPLFQVVPAGEETLVYCTVGLWYREGENPSATVYGVGGDKAVAKGKDGPRTSDEAFKAAYTDALSNAMKQIGVGADVHMGLFDDHKYVREMEKEFAEENGNGAHKEEPKPTKGKFDLIDPNGVKLGSYDSADDWCDACRLTLTNFSDQAAAIWSVNKATAAVIRQHYAVANWRSKGVEYHPCDVLERMASMERKVA